MTCLLCPSESQSEKQSKADAPGSGRPHPLQTFGLFVKHAYKSGSELVHKIFFRMTWVEQSTEIKHFTDGPSSPRSSLHPCICHDGQLHPFPLEGVIHAAVWAHAASF